MRDTADLVLLTGATDETGQPTPPASATAAAPLRSANVAPTDPIRVLLSADGRRRLRPARWGLVPPWSADANGAARMINARVETVTQKPSYRRAIRTARCVLPADGWYEWQLSGGAAGQPKPTRTPHLVQRADGEPLWLAGLWAQWHPPGAGEPLMTAAVLTGPAPDQLAWLHERAPLTVRDRDLDAWLDADGGDPQAVLEALVGVGYPALRWHDVSREIGQVRVKGAHLMQPVAAPAPTGSTEPVPKLPSQPDSEPLALF